MKTGLQCTLAVAAALCAGCRFGSGLEPKVSAEGQITGAGATFPAPIYQKWFGEFHRQHFDITINYQDLGSGAGIQQLAQGTVDFGATDMPMTDAQIGAMKIKPLHFPTVIGGIVPAYNLPDWKDLKFSPEALAGIFLGEISKWNDPILEKDNPGVNLPSGDIVVVHRADGSGTSFVFTDYLAKVSPEWVRKVGPPSTSVKWPTGLGGKGNEGVAGQVKHTPGAIGYVELNYAVQNRMEFGSLKNAAGRFVKADFTSVAAAAGEAARDIPADFRVSITNSPGQDSYPIASFTWLLIPSRISDTAKARYLKEFLQWMLTDGQKYATGMSYAPLPQEVAAKVNRQIGMIQ